MNLPEIDIIEEDFMPKPKLSLKERWNLWREKRRNKNKEKTSEIPTKKDLFIEKIFVGMHVLVTCIAAAGALCLSVAAIAFLPKILLTTLFVGLTWLGESIVTKTIEEFKEIKKLYDENKTNNVEETEEKQKKKEKKSGFFKKIKNRIFKSKKVSNETEEEYNQEDTIENDTDNNRFNLNKLTNPVMITSWNVGRVEGLGIYYISIPKESKNAQKFIREELKEKMPEETIQTFETEKEKVFVLNRKPNIFR